MTTDTAPRLPTRQLIQPDLPVFDADAVAPELREALAELLLTMADDEFVIGFRDSEWTGIAPMLEEDVAFSSIAQDEIGHARLLYEMRGALTGEDPDKVAFGREPNEYRHARLLDHPRNGWAFTNVRRWLYDTADAARLAALAKSSFEPLAQVVVKIRREERYHLMHLDSWLTRLATSPGKPRGKVLSALKQLVPDAQSVFAPLKGERVLIDAGVLGAPMVDIAARWRAEASARLCNLNLRPIDDVPPPADGRDHAEPHESFVWLWNEFTSVSRLEEGAQW
ncbi:MAG: 1,2-phenylacetyl-CoA epoxidase subunit PaaC [Candidatus Limnocylindrales bacterium]